MNIRARFAAYLPAVSLRFFLRAVVGISNRTTADFLDCRKKEVREKAQSFVAPRVYMPTLTAFRKREHRTVLHLSDITLNGSNRNSELFAYLGVCLFFGYEWASFSVRIVDGNLKRIFLVGYRNESLHTHLLLHSKLDILLVQVVNRRTDAQAQVADGSHPYGRIIESLQVLVQHIEHRHLCLVLYF